MVSVLPKLNVGMVFGVTVTVNVVVVPHSPAFGVNVYTASAWLFTVAGLHVPLMPLVDVVVNVGAVAPAQIVNVVPKLNVGVSIGFTVTVSVVGTAHNPAVGVNVYTSLAVLLIVAGLHVPVIPLVDVVGNAGTAAPSQTLSVVPKLNVGVMFGFTVTVNVVVVAHCPPEGVNVYTALAVLLTVVAAHVPVIPLSDVFGNAGTLPPEQIVNVVPKLNVGVMFTSTVTVKVVGTAHCPAVGVNV